MMVGREGFPGPGARQVGSRVGDCSRDLSSVPGGTAGVLQGSGRLVRGTGNPIPWYPNLCFALERSFLDLD